MILKDHKKLQRLMILAEVSQQELALVAGFGPKSHSVIGRLCRGELKTIKTERALAIAARLEVPVESLFVLRSSSKPAQPAQSVKAAS